MPKRQDIKKVMIIGSGPIIIGQACEFDYSGTQACKALRKLGYEIVLVNSNPATIMTDPEMADITYIEPLNVKTVTEIIKKERPDALLPNLGGQSALNLSADLYKAGVLTEHGVEILGVQAEAIERGEDRIAFKETMNRLGIETARSKPAYSVEEAEKIAAELGYPVVIRPAYTLGGTGGGLVYNTEELQAVASRGIAASRIGQILVEESVLGWDELELEVIRDAKNRIITVCFIENIDPMGTHTGDSLCVTPMLTIEPAVQKELERQAHAIVEAIGVIGGINVQFAHDPKTGRIVVIEINPRTSRSSALASKATGFPIALVSALLAAGLTLDELPYWREKTLDKYTPQSDYVVVKFARWAFEKFKGIEDKLGTQMRAVGEVMSIGKNYKEALQKAVRSLEIGRYGLGFAKDFHRRSLPELLKMLHEPNSERQFLMYEALRKGASIDELHRLTKIKPWFIQQMKELVDLEEEIRGYRGKQIPGDLLARAKRDGFSDRYLAGLLSTDERKLRTQRRALGITKLWKKVPVSGVEGEAAYYYSTYTPGEVTGHIQTGAGRRESPRKKSVMILGGGPNRIGQGIEFDYCCVHAAFALREAGVETIMVNCNPETVSTDYDTSDKLYFEPLTVEEVLSIYEREQPEGVIVQFGGQTPLNIAGELAEAGVRILGTPPDIIDLAEDRDRFRRMMEKLGIPMPEAGMAHNLEEALALADSIGYPLMVRPSYVLGGRGMEIIHDEEMLREYLAAAVEITPERPVLIDRFLDNAIEAEADALADGTDAFVPVVMEHIELAGVHSGDSACVLPSVSISPQSLAAIYEYTAKIAQELEVVGLLNIQYAITDGKVYVLEANPRASRTVPLVSKVCNLSMVRLATILMLPEEMGGKRLAALNLNSRSLPHFGVKESVFPFNMFPEVDPLLGPEMRSTGEVLGLSDSFGTAYYKSQEAAGQLLPTTGTVLLSVADRDKEAAFEVAKRFTDLGFTIFATAGTHAFLKRNGIKSELVHKLYEGRPNLVDRIMNKEIHIVINTPVGKRGQYDDSYIRKAAIKYKIPYITTIAAALASVKGIAASRNKPVVVKSLQEYHQALKDPE
ncbi:MAG: carbamoyl-phosphate synthase large subunit [Firmicutes bacterium]|nr:carbamoyl-phosphate synthase large subunit [Bacillota bacterium]